MRDRPLAADEGHAQARREIDEELRGEDEEHHGHRHPGGNHQRSPARGEEDHEEGGPLDGELEAGHRSHAAAEVRSLRHALLVRLAEAGEQEGGEETDQARAEAENAERLRPEHARDEHGREEAEAVRDPRAREEDDRLPSEIASSLDHSEAPAPAPRVPDAPLGVHGDPRTRERGVGRETAVMRSVDGSKRTILSPMNSATHTAPEAATAMAYGLEPRPEGMGQERVRSVDGSSWRS